MTDGMATPEHQGRPGLPVVGVRVGVGVDRDVEHPRVSATTILDHQGDSHLLRLACHQQQRRNRQGQRLRQAYNQGHNTGPTEGPAIDALNDSASTVERRLNDALSRTLRDAFNAYVDAAHAVANAIGTHASTGGVQQAGRPAQRHQDQGVETVSGRPSEVAVTARLLLVRR